MSEIKCRTLLIAAICLLTSAYTVSAGDDDRIPIPEDLKTGYDSITSSEALSHVVFLASDELEGRDTPSMGLRIAGNYVKSFYKRWGILPIVDIGAGEMSFEQRVDFVISKPALTTYAEVTHENVRRRFSVYTDLLLSKIGLFSGVIEAPVAFVGYGYSYPDLGYDDLDGVDLEGKIALVIYGVPGGNREDSQFNTPEFHDYYTTLWGGYYKIIDALKSRGAVAILSFALPGSDPFEKYYWYIPDRKGEYKQGDSTEAPYPLLAIPEVGEELYPLPFFRISRRLANHLLESEGITISELKSRIDSTLIPCSANLEDISLKINVQTTETLASASNIVGFIEGADPKLKDEYVVVGAHLDHIGIVGDGYVCNGADDNASGSAGVLEIAQAFALNPVKPKRSIVFAHWIGEERGLLGSRYFVRNSPLPIDKIVAYLNFDMIGRDWTEEELEKRWDSVATSPDMEITPFLMTEFCKAYVSAQSPELLKLIDETNQNYVGLFYQSLPLHDMFSGGDHDPFHRLKIPNAFIRSAPHDDYHKPTDTSEKLNGEKMARIIKLVYLVANEIANKPGRINWEQ